jgi:hypothetical protein
MRSSRLTMAVGGGVLAVAAVGGALAMRDDGRPARAVASAPPELPRRLATSGATAQVPRVVGAKAGRVVELLEQEACAGTWAATRAATRSDARWRARAGRARSRPRPSPVLTLDCDAADCSDRDGAAWKLFDAAYEVGRDEGCERAFAPSAPAYRLHYEDRTLRPADRRIDNPRDGEEAAPPAPPRDPVAAGLALGRRDGCEHAFGLSPDGRLYGPARVLDARTCDAPAPDDAS